MKIAILGAMEIEIKPFLETLEDYKEVTHGLKEKHADRRETRAQRGKRLGNRVDDRVDHMPLVQHVLDGAGNADQ